MVRRDGLSGIHWKWVAQDSVDGVYVMRPILCSWFPSLTELSVLLHYLRLAFSSPHSLFFDKRVSPYKKILVTEPRLPPLSGSGARPRVGQVAGGQLPARARRGAADLCRAARARTDAPADACHTHAPAGNEQLKPLRDVAV